MHRDAILPLSTTCSLFMNVQLHSALDTGIQRELQAVKLLPSVTWKHNFLALLSTDHRPHWAPSSWTQAMASDTNHPELGQTLEIKGTASTRMPSLQTPASSVGLSRPPELLISWLQTQEFPLLPQVQQFATIYRTQESVILTTAVLLQQKDINQKQSKEETPRARSIRDLKQEKHCHCPFPVKSGCLTLLAH